MPEAEHPTPAQGCALADLMRRFNADRADVTLNPFDLPNGYLHVAMTRQGADILPGGGCGIAPNGDVSS